MARLRRPQSVFAGGGELRLETLTDSEAEHVKVAVALIPTRLTPREANERLVRLYEALDASAERTILDRLTIDVEYV